MSRQIQNLITLNSEIVMDLSITVTGNILIRERGNEKHTHDNTSKRKFYLWHKIYPIMKVNVQIDFHIAVVIVEFEIMRKIACQLQYYEIKNI